MAEEAATKIQATYRGYQARQNLRKYDKHSNTSPIIPTVTTTGCVDPNYAATKIQANFRGYRTRKGLSLHGTENQMERVHINPDTTYRGYHSRQNLGKELSDISNQAKHPSNEELNEAATKIQAAFRGHHVRHHLVHRHEAECSVECSNDFISRTAGSDELEADSRIQANYQNFCGRKEAPLSAASITSPSCDYDSPDGRYEHAATKIQANFRGYLVRKDIHGQPTTENYPPSPVDKSWST